MSGSLSPVAHAHQRLSEALSTVPDVRVTTSVVTSTSPPALVVGPPRLRWTDYGSTFSGQPTTAQWNIYLVTPMNQYAIDVLLSHIATITSTIERLTPGVVLAAGPGYYPSPSGPLPAYIILVQAEITMMQ